ncbi:MAG: hypothetical protein COA42_04140 [Alteromonadaceae bacterium]|nr:MAG: hypothetical protein COA42_04140 [Alteromonadaceae bacterium]
MNTDEIKTALIDIKKSLSNTDNIDDETVRLAFELERELERVLETKGITQGDSLSSSVDLAMALETRFESEHPVAAGCVREIIQVLHKIGI